MGKVTGKVIAMYNRKGGVAKTTSTVAFAGILERLGKRVLVVDLDGSCNCSSVFKVSNDEETGGLFKMICENMPIEDTIKSSEDSMVDVIPSGYRQIDACEKLWRMRSDPMVLPYEVIGILKKNLAQIEDKYDYILLDCSPSEDIISECVLAAASDVIAPVGSDKLSYLGISWIYNKIQDARERYNPDLNFVGTLMTSVSKSGADFKYFHAGYIKTLGEDAICQPIRKDAEIARCISSDMPMFNVMRRSRAKADYIKAACEIGLISEADARRLLARFAQKGDEDFEYVKGVN